MDSFGLQVPFSPDSSQLRKSEYQQRLGVSKLRSDISGNYQSKFFEINSIYFHTRKN